MSQVDVDRAVGYALKRAQTALHAAMDAELRSQGLSVPQYVCLELLVQHPGLTNVELARRAFVSRQAMHQLLGGLRNTGLVAGDDQGRKERFTVTENGLQRLAGASTVVAAIEERMVAPLSVAGRRQLHAALTQCVEALEQATPASPAPNG